MYGSLHGVEAGRASPQCKILVHPLLIFQFYLREPRQKITLARSNLKLYGFLIMVWGVKSCNYVHSGSASPFVLRVWPFKCPSHHHLKRQSHAEAPAKIVHRKMVTKEISVPKPVTSCHNIHVIISQA